MSDSLMRELVKERIQGLNGKEILDHVNNLIASSYNEFDILERAHDMLGEATRAFDGEAFYGTAILCRSTLEAAFHDFLTMKWHPSGEYLILDEPLTLVGEPRRVEWSELEQAMEKTGLLAVWMRDVRRIRDDGNLIAHYSQRQNRLRQKWSKEMEEIERELPGLRKEKVEAWGKLLKRMNEDTPASISRVRALRDLRDTASILLSVSRAVKPPIDERLL